MVRKKGTYCRRMAVSVLLVFALLVAVVPSIGVSASQFKLSSGSGYTINEGQRYVFGVASETTTETFCANFPGQNISIINSVGKILQPNKPVVTGANARLLNGTTVVDTLVIVVGGDVDCDGKVTANDYLSIKVTFKSNSKLTGARFAAADIDGNSVVSSTDYLMIRRHIAGKYAIRQKAGKEYVTVPNVVSFSETYAKTQLANVGLKCSVTYANNEYVDASMVISQSVNAGVIAEAGTEVAIVVSLGSSSQGGQKSYTPINYADNMKAIWISQFDIAETFWLTGASAFESSIDAVFAKCANMGINTIIMQVRPNGDSFYPSDYFPWSKYVLASTKYSPTMNKSYDPLAILLKKAHARGLSVQAWINPIRIMQTSEISLVNDKYLIKQWYNSGKVGTYLVEFNGYYYLNPAYPEIRKLVVDGVAEICRKYDVDGIHMDDYFYPTPDAWFDAPAFAASGQSNLNTFRKNNFSILVKNMYDTIKSIDSRILYGISPAANITHVVNTDSANVTLWCSTSGYIDYIMPQIYLGFNNSSSTGNFIEVASQWNRIITSSSVKYYVGLPLYKAGDAEARNQWDGNEYDLYKDVIKRQIQHLDNSVPKCKGVCIYSYGYLTKASQETNNMIPAIKSFSN